MAFVYPQARREMSSSFSDRLVVRHYPWPCPWLRTGSGFPVLVFFAVLLCFSSLRRSIRVLLSAVLLIGLSLPLFYAQFSLHERDSFLATHQPGYRRSLSHHLFWHTAYVGLSYLKNPYVHAWRDSAAVEYVQAMIRLRFMAERSTRRFCRPAWKRFFVEIPVFSFIR